jgi:elongation factor Ts
MATISADDIRKLREATGAPVMRAKKLLEELNGDMQKAEEILMKEGFEKTEKRLDRETSQGIIDTYIHHSGKMAVMVELLCETDFVAKNELFRELAHNISIQVASLGTTDKEKLLEEDFIKDPSRKVGDMIKEVIAKTGENVQLGRVIRLELGRE